VNLPGLGGIGQRTPRRRPAGQQPGPAAGRQGRGQAGLGPGEDLGLAIRDARLFDWLDRHLAA
jgi:hypothetical protein